MTDLQGQVEWRRRLRTELLRWHPDKLQAAALLRCAARYYRGLPGRSHVM